MNVWKFIAYSTAGAFIWSILLVQLGVVFGERWAEIRHMLQPFDLLIAAVVIAAVVLFVWWRLGTPGLDRVRRRPNDADA
jgi:membrane protein DedA with SNARE-associated domain